MNVHDAAGKGAPGKAPLGKDARVSRQLLDACRGRGCGDRRQRRTAKHVQGVQ